MQTLIHKNLLIIGGAISISENVYIVSYKFLPDSQHTAAEPFQIVSKTRVSLRDILTCYIINYQ